MATTDLAQTKLSPIALSRPQMSVFRSPARFRVLVAGRRFGKSYLARVIALAGASKPGTEVWIVSPTLRQGRAIHWLPLKALVPRRYVADVRESELTVRLVGGSAIGLRGVENQDMLRGAGLDMLVADEFDTWGSDAVEAIWEPILRPTLSDRLGRAVFIGTPQGYGPLYSFYQRGQDGTNWPNWSSWQYTTLDGGRVPAAEVEEARATLSERSFRQEYEATFETSSKRVYDYFDRSKHLGPVDVRDGELLVGIDFNINPMSAVVAQKDGEHCGVLRAVQLETANTDMLCRELQRLYPGRKIRAYPDPSGRRRQTSAGGRTDFSILRDHGFQVRAPAKAPQVSDRVNNVQANLYHGCVQIDPGAKALIAALEGQGYDAEGKPDKLGGLDHLADAFGYLLWLAFPRFRSRANVVPYPL